MEAVEEGAASAVVVAAVAEAAEVTAAPTVPQWVGEDVGKAFVEIDP